MPNTSHISPMDGTLTDLSNSMIERKLYPIYKIKWNKYHAGNQIHRKNNEITRDKESGSTESLASHFLLEAHFHLQIYIKPENDIYSNRKITNTAYLLTWKPGVIGTIMATRLSSRFGAKGLESKSIARDMIVSATNGQKNKTIVLIARAIY